MSSYLWSLDFFLYPLLGATGCDIGRSYTPALSFLAYAQVSYDASYISSASAPASISTPTERGATPVLCVPQTKHGW